MNQLELKARDPVTAALPLGADDSNARAFDDWRQTPGGKRVLQMAYAISAGYAARYKRTGRLVSMKLVWELLRDSVAAVASKREAMKLEKVGGFTLNNNFTAYIARHIIAHKPQWDGLFQMRELGQRQPVKRKTVTVTEETFK